MKGTAEEFRQVVVELQEIRLMYVEALHQLDVLAGIVTDGKRELAEAHKQLELLGDSDVQDRANTD
jgi:hypothetical protein